MSTTTTTESPRGAAATWEFTDGKFIRNGELIATMIDGQPVFTELGEKYKHVVLKRLKETARAAASTPLPTPIVTAPVVATPPPTPPAADMWATLAPQQREAITWLRKRAGFDPFHVEPRTKKPVKADKFIGDKSEAYVLDLLRYEPLVFVENYGLLRMGKMERMERVMDKDRGLKVKKRVEVAVAISVRKTHLTERADNMHLVDEDETNE